jgi:hypothetical protein
MNKVFEQDLHDIHDELGRYNAKRFFNKLGFDVEDNKDKYGVDLLSYLDGEFRFYIEVEHRSDWIGDWKFNTVHIPKRKNKFIFGDKKTIFMTFNNDCSRAFIIEDKNVFNSPIVSIWIKRNNMYESFFDVDINLCKQVILL